MTLLLIALGAAAGAPLRHLTDLAIHARRHLGFPWGTLTVNVAGSLLLGFVAGLPASPAVVALVGNGFCGALTTYSTFSYETLRLAREGSRLLALANIVASVMGGLTAATCGMTLAMALAG